MSLAAITFVESVQAHTPSSSPCSDPVCNIDIQDNSFSLAAITVPSPNTTTGQNVTVSWFNHGSFLHSVTTGPQVGLPDGIIDHDVQPGTYFNLTLTQALYTQLIHKYPNGVVPYYCKYHYSLGMAATLTISPIQVPEFSMPTLLLTITLLSAIVVFGLSHPERRLSMHPIRGLQASLRKKKNA